MKEQNFETVIVYSKNNCMQCKMTKKYLDEHQILYQEINIDEQPVARQKLVELGYRSVPVTFFKDMVVAGFAPNKLKQFELMTK